MSGDCGAIFGSRHGAVLTRALPSSRGASLHAIVSVVLPFIFFQRRLLDASQWSPPDYSIFPEFADLPTFW